MLKEKSRCCYKTFTGWSVEHKKLLRCERRAAGWSCVSRLTRRHRASFKMQLVCLPLCESRCFAAHPAGKRGFWYHYVPEHFKFYAHQEKKNKETKLTSQDCVTILHRQWDFIHKLFYTDRTKYLLLFCVFINFFWFMYSDNATDQPSIDSWWSVWKKPGRENDLAAK